MQGMFIKTLADNYFCILLSIALVNSGCKILYKTLKVGQSISGVKSL